MPFYESVHCGVWRVELNSQYLWQYLSGKGVQIQGKFDVEQLCYLVEDRLNVQTFNKIINVNAIIDEELEKLLLLKR